MKIIVLLSTLLMSQFSSAQIDRKGNGGDIYAVEFVDTAQKVVDTLVVQQSETAIIKKLSEKIRSALVESTDDQLFLDGVRKDAINYPDIEKIIFNRKGWATANERTRMLLVLHEYLGLLRINDSRYSVSGSILKEVAKKSMICVSVVQNSHNHFFVTGKAAVNLAGTGDVKWADENYTYSIAVNGFINPTFFVLAVFDSELKIIQRVTSNLHMTKPEVNLNFAVDTGKTLNGHPITDIEVECR